MSTLPLILGLLMGLGLALAWLAWTADPLVPATRPDPVAGEPPLVRLAGWLRRTGLALTPGQFLLRVALGGLGLAVALLALTGSPVLALGGAGVGLALLVTSLDRRAAAAEHDRLADLELAIGQLQGLIDAQRSLAAAIVELAEHGPEALRPAFARAARTAALAGGGLATGLAGLRETIGPAADDLVEALVIAHRAGIDALRPVLDQLAANLRGRREVEAAIATAQHRTVIQGRVLAVAPLAMLVLLRWVAPNYVAVYDTPQGAVWLAGVAGVVALGYTLMRRLGRVSPPPRARRA